MLYPTSDYLALPITPSPVSPHLPRRMSTAASAQLTPEVAMVPEACVLAWQGGVGIEVHDLPNASVAPLAGHFGPEFNH